MLMAMAWRNLLRYKKRTAVTACAIAMGVLCSIVMDGLLAGLDMESWRNLVAYETSMAKVYAPGYFADRLLCPMDTLLEADDRLVVEEALADQQMRWTPRVSTRASVHFMDDDFPAAGSLDVLLVGVDPLRDASVFSQAQGISEGRWLQEGNDGAVIGSWLAHDMGGRVGSYVTIEAKGRGGFIQTMDVPIVGIVQTDNPVVNSTGVYMDISVLDELLELDGAVSEYAFTHGGSNLTISEQRVVQALPALRLALGHADVRTWDDIAQQEVKLSQSKQASSKLMLLCMFIIAAVGISNTMLMAVHERKDEIGMLKALGFTPWYIQSLFAIEGILVGVLGAIVGILLGMAATYPLVHVGIDMSSLIEGVNIGYRVTGIMRAAWNYPSYVLIGLGALVVSAFSAWVPVRSISQAEISKIFRSI